MNSPSVLTQTILKQRRAADPKASAFVSANAGSGKTFVLVRRILRLLVQGVEPTRILALTYTTAAAANMANRVFEDLSKWVRLDDSELAAILTDLDGEQPKAKDIRRARQLFARAIETPGGLKIQTIHAFCERVLHLFPFEANVPAGFKTLDEDEARALIEKARNFVIQGSARLDDAAFADALRQVADEAGETRFDDFIRKVLRFQSRIRTDLADQAGLDAMLDRLDSRLGLNRRDTTASILADIRSGRLSDAECQNSATILFRSTKSSDHDLAQKLIQSCAVADETEWFEKYCDIFLTKERSPRSDKRFITSAIRSAHPQLVTALVRERERLANLIDKMRSVAARERTRALILVARAIIAAYEEDKARLGVLDFSDLVERTRLLLKRSSAQWVLYKLDKGIDHLLIDEAQDTSPEQWDALERLTDEFFSGEGARSDIRTVFAVGDPKQSIYSFQGADPKKFSEYRDRFERRVTSITSKFRNHPYVFYREELTVSFRSVPDVLQAVDAIFRLPEYYQGLDSEAHPTQHISHRMQAPGLVEIWDVIRKETDEVSDDWLTPVDRPEERAPSVELARRIATHIAGLVDPSSHERIEYAPGAFRAIVPRDILILVRKRGVFFENVIRALKDAGLPVAGADRLKLANHIAVMDLVALGQSVLTPDDDLTLATVLKSPLIGLDDDDLMQLAPTRTGSLYTALAETDISERVIAARVRYMAYREAAKLYGPYGFYAYVLGQGRGRARFRARLGREAEDAIDEFLRLALEHDHSETPSLMRFLASFSKAEREVRRDMESGRNEIRVMTVHGAKGLEAPIVYLPDTCGKAEGNGIDPVFELYDDRLTLLWARGEQDDSASMTSLRNEVAARVYREHRRLLYVALTRAKDRIYIGGYTGKNAPAADCWYNMIEKGLAERLQYRTDADGKTLRQLQTLPYPDAEAVLQNSATPIQADLPDWVMSAPPEEDAVVPPLKPSNVLEAADQNDRPVDLEFARQARRRGTLVHMLLELLPDVPDERRENAGRAWLSARARELDNSTRAQLLNDALALLRSPDLAGLFGPKSRAEAPVAGLLHRVGKPPITISGKIDRLVVNEIDVIIADYKTAMRTPDTVDGIPAAYIAQLAAYRALIATLYPTKSVRCLLIYTSGPTWFEIPPAQLDKSFSDFA